MTNIRKMKKLDMVFIGLLTLSSILLVFMLIFDNETVLFHVGILEPNEIYAQETVDEMNNYAKECGINMPHNIKVEVRSTIDWLELSGSDNDHSLPNAYIIFPPIKNKTLSSRIIVLPRCSHKTSTLSHEVAHQIMWSKGYIIEDHHQMVEFHQWQICLLMSKKLDTNICKMVKMG